LGFEKNLGILDGKPICTHQEASSSLSSFNVHMAATGENPSNGNSGVAPESSSTKHNPAISLHWTSEEHAKGLKYSNLIVYFYFYFLCWIVLDFGLLMAV
jgi:hypothetical protein